MNSDEKLKMLKESDLYLMHLDSFEWSDYNTDEELNTWYRIKDKNFSKYFEIFGQDGTGGLFALWYQKGKNAQENETLIAYFDSEGQLGVAATSLDEFLSIMATGCNLFDFVFYNRMSYYNDFTKDPDEKSEREADQNKFINFLKKKLGITPAKNLDELRKKSQIELSVLQEWLKDFIK